MGERKSHEYDALICALYQGDEFVHDFIFCGEKHFNFGAIYFCGLISHS